MPLLFSLEPILAGSEISLRNWNKSSITEKTQNPLFAPAVEPRPWHYRLASEGDREGGEKLPLILRWKVTFHPGIGLLQVSESSFEQLLWTGALSFPGGRLLSTLRRSKISIFQKSWEWVCLVWKMFPHPWRLFLTYLEVPSAHIWKNPKISKINYLINLLNNSPYFPLFARFGILLFCVFSDPGAGMC